jgi:uncharacterized protein YegP (UPF0339 family)
MATATRKRQAGPRAHGGRSVPEPAKLEFFVHQDNGGDYQWEIVGERGEHLARSHSFASYDDAERAARCVHDGAGSARFEPHVTKDRGLGGV